MITLQRVEDEDHVAQARALFREYADTRKGDPALEGFPEEITALPGNYAPPDGNIILAYHNGKAAGCVAVRKLDEHICEMKRLYVSPMFRGKGVGRYLVEAILKQARLLGYARMRLDTIPGMQSAQMLYESMGFSEIPAYRNNPNTGTKYYEVELPAKSTNLM